MPSPAVPESAPPPSERERLPAVFLGIVMAEAASIAALYYLGVYFG